MTVIFIDAVGLDHEQIREEVLKCTNEACVVHNIKHQAIQSLEQFLIENAQKKVYAEFSNTEPTPKDVFLVDKNHEINFDGREISRKRKLHKSSSDHVKTIIESREDLNNRFELATKAAKMGVWTYDVETERIFWDEKMLEIYRIESFDGQFETFTNLVHENEREQELKSLFSYIADENMFEYEVDCRVNTHDSEEVYVRGKAIIERENGVAKKITGVVWDRSEERKTELKSKEQNERLALLESFIDQSTDAIQVSDESGQLVYVNEAAAERLAIEKEHVANYHVGNFEPLFKEKSAWKNHIKELKANSPITIQSVNFNQLTKEPFPVEVRVTLQTINGQAYVIANSRDITERKKAEDQLKESEEQFRFIAENTSDGIAVFEDDHISYSSHAYNTILGYSGEEGKKHSQEFIYSILHPEDRDLTFELINESIKNRESSFTYQFRVKHKKGHYIWREDTANQFYDEQGNLIKTILVARDITARKNDEIALKESEEMLANIADSIPGLVMRYILNADGTDEIQFVSKGAEALWEIPHAQMMGDSSKIWSKIHPDDLDDFVKTLQDSSKEMKPWSYDYRAIMDDGRVKWISGIGQPKRLDDGCMLWHSLALDITDKKNAELELEKTLQHLNLSIKTGKMGIWELNVKDGHLDWNDQMFNVFGVEKSTFDHSVETFRKTVHPEDIEFMDGVLGELRIAPVLNDTQFRIIKPDGQVRHIHVSGNPSSFHEDGTIEKYIGVNIDVTHIAEYQEQLKATVAEKDALFKELHHRIKNNLQMVSSLLFIKSTMTEDMQLKRFIDETSTKIQSISAIHEQLLQMQGVDQMDVRKYLDSLCQNLVTTYSYGSSKFDLKITLDSAIMDIDRVLNIGLIVNEIISNTMKYAYPESDKGKIHVSLKNKNNSSVLTVSDDGIGIPPEKISNMGNSYGMQLISIFAQQINGTLDIENANGTKFTIKFPTNV